MSRLARKCPKCSSLRNPGEVVCENEVTEGQTCGFPLMNVRPTVHHPVSTDVTSPQVPEEEPETASDGPAGRTLLCPNGHENEIGDAECITCGARLSSEVLPPPAVDRIGSWRLLERLEAEKEDAELFRVRQEETGELALLRWFGHGIEPRTRTYAVLRRLQHENLARLIDFGRDNERSWEVWDQTVGASLASVLATQSFTGDRLREIVRQLASALEALEAANLRHGNLTPCAVRFTDEDLHRLQLGDLSTATLAEFDLEAAGAGRMSRYASPEAVVGTQSASSDWWSLGVILIEITTQGRCFDEVNDRAFLLHTIARGVEIPEGLPVDTTLLLKGLLTRDHSRRWRGAEVRRWLAGETDIPVYFEGGQNEPTDGQVLSIGGRPVRNAAAFALASASAENWNEALGLVEMGSVASWLAAIGEGAEAATLKSIMDERRIETDARFALALLALNPHLPLVVKGEIQTPNRLLEDPQAAGIWFEPPVVAILKRLKRESWLIRLSERARRVEARAQELNLRLVEDRFKAARLAAFEAKLESFWRARRAMFPDARVPGISALLERRTLTDEDLILLICADDASFRSEKEVLDEAEKLCREVRVSRFDRAIAARTLQQSKRQIIDTLTDRLGAFKRCGVEALDSWADSLRLGRRLSLAQLLVLHASDTALWVEPPHQDYLNNILQFLQKKILVGVQRGPLVKLQIGRSATRIDLMDLGGAEVARTILDRAVKRDEQLVLLAPSTGRGDERLDKLKRIAQRSNLHQRETGVSALVVAWPLIGFVDKSLNGAASFRLAPLILWPIRLRSDQGRAGIEFDTARDPEMNPALDRVLGEDVAARWRQKLEPALRGEVQSLSDIGDALEGLASLPETMAPGPIPEAASFKGISRHTIVSAGAVMLAEFPSQAIVEDLKRILGQPLAGSSLEPLLRLVDPVDQEPLVRPVERDRYSTLDADPSQEEAVLAARQSPGLKLEGPPGTGKSQTIVNIIADCIGRGETVMLVCEKQAALEVVHKRLRAEGLGHRVVRIEDTKSDRKRLLEDLQAQIPSVLTTPRERSKQLRTQRSEAASVVDRLETDLTSYHETVYAPSETLGLSYRHIVSRIAALEIDAQGLAAPDLRQVLGKLKPAELEAVVGECLGLVETWYEADLSQPVLSIFKTFGSDVALEQRLAEGFVQLREAEDKRRGYIAAAAPMSGLPVNAQESALLDWLKEVGTRLRSLSASARKRVADWQPLLMSDPGARSQAAQLAEELARMIALLQDAALTPDERALSDRITVADSDVLRTLQNASSLFAARRPLLDGLNPFSALSRGSIKRLLRTMEIGETRTIAEAACKSAGKELLLRQLRTDYEAVARRLDLREDVAAFSAEALRKRADKLRTAVEQAIGAQADLMSCIWPAPLMQALAEPQVSWEAAFARLDAAANLVGATALVKTCLNDLAAWATDQWSVERQRDLERHEPLGSDIGGIIAALPRLRAYQTFRQSRVGPQATAVFGALLKQREKLDADSPRRREIAVAAFIRREAYHAWSEQLREDLPILANPPHQVLRDVERLSAADAAMQEINKKYLGHIDPTKIAPQHEWAQIWNVRGNNARQLRQVFGEGRERGLLEARPIWLVNPDVASRVFPLEPGLFDVAIFDEASQMRVENAVPALYRAKRAIISGDSKQLPPTAFFGTAVSDDDEEDLLLSEALGEDADAESADRRKQDAALNRRHVKDCQDLLALSQGVLPERNLTIHYRSAYRELIEFSNAAFYNGQLNIPVNHPVGEVLRHVPIEVRRVDGVYGNQCNPAEADAVVNHLVALWSAEGSEPPTVGVVTFNLKQAELIDDRIQKRAFADPRFRAALSREQARKADGEDVSFFVRNLENVQGDERDHIVFSTTFGRDGQGVFRKSFGVLTHTGGERRLNVAVTRAKSKVTVVTSMPTHDISDVVQQQRSPNKAREYLHLYMRYAELLSEGQLDAARAQLGAFEATALQTTHDYEDDAADALVERVREVLTSGGFVTELRPLKGAFAVDVAVVHSKTGLYCLGVELDGPRHPVLNSAKARDIWRPRLLERQGMKLHRVLSAAWAADPAREQERLLKAAREATL